MGNYTHIRCSALATLLSLFFYPLLSWNVAAHEFGYFKGKIKVEWLNDGRLMKTLAKISYTDPDGQKWIVPRGTITDGATVPKYLHSFYAPFSGKYRKAALVHDRYCDIKTRSWQATHEVFYYALLASGVTTKKSKLMWSAVYLFGPRWSVGNKRSLPHKGQKVSQKKQEKTIQEISAWLESGDKSLDDLEEKLAGMSSSLR